MDFTEFNRRQARRRMIDGACLALDYATRAIVIVAAIGVGAAFLGWW